MQVPKISLKERKVLNTKVIQEVFVEEKGKQTPWKMLLSRSSISSATGF